MENTKKISFEVLKGVQNLQSWLTFYRLNQKYNDAVKTQNQITEYKLKYGLVDNY